MANGVTCSVQVSGALKHSQRHPFTGFDLWHTYELPFSPVPLVQSQNREIISEILKTLFWIVFSPPGAYQNRNFVNITGKLLNPFKSRLTDPLGEPACEWVPLESSQCFCNLDRVRDARSGQERISSQSKSTSKYACLVQVRDTLVLRL